MGCDIHPFIEYYDATDPAWVHCYAKDIRLGRNYTLFNALAGVRGHGGCVVNPRGLPARPEVSMDVFDKFYQKIVDVVEITDSYRNSQISKADAERYANQYKLTQLHVRGQNYIQNPSWHTPSHLELTEMVSVRRKYLLDIIDFDIAYKGKKRKEVINILKNVDDYELMKCCFSEIECPSLNAVIGSMIAIENSGNYKSRFVFWFDS